MNINYAFSQAKCVNSHAISICGDSMALNSQSECDRGHRNLIRDYLKRTSCYPQYDLWNVIIPQRERRVKDVKYDSMYIKESKIAQTSIL